MGNKDIATMVSEKVEEVTQKICDHYCKWPSEYEDSDVLFDEKCMKCPLGEL